MQHEIAELSKTARGLIDNFAVEQTNALRIAAEKQEFLAKISMGELDEMVGHMATDAIRGGGGRTNGNLARDMTNAMMPAGLGGGRGAGRLRSSVDAAVDSSRNSNEASQQIRKTYPAPDAP